MNNMEKKSQPTFSWMAYGALSLGMLMIAAVTATVGQDKTQSAGTAASGLTSEQLKRIQLELASGRAFEKSKLKNNRTDINDYLWLRITRTLHPETMSRRAMPAPEYQYAVRLHLEDNRQPIENLVRFEVTKTDQRGLIAAMTESRPVPPFKSAVVGTGILQIDSGAIYMETKKDNGLVTLEQLNRDHFASMIGFSVDKSPTKQIVASQ